MESPETFTQLALQIDATTKLLSTNSDSSLLTQELISLNSLHKSLQKDIDTSHPQYNASHNVPPPPIPVSQKRSNQITKLRESGNASLKKSQASDAIRMYTLAIEMAIGRPAWEPWALVREEVAALLSNRAQAQISIREWPMGLVDAEASLEMKAACNVKAWYRAGVCLREMGRLEDAREMLARGIEFESAAPERGAISELENLLGEVEGALADARKKVGKSG